MNAVARIEYKPLYREAKQSAGMVRLGWGQAGTREGKWAVLRTPQSKFLLSQVTSQSWGLDSTCLREDQALAPWVPKI